MDRMFVLILTPHETSPPTHEMMEHLTKLLTKLGTLHEFTSLSSGRKFQVKLCAKHTARDLQAAFRGMMVNAKVKEQKGDCHDCRAAACD